MKEVRSVSGFVKLELEGLELEKNDDRPVDSKNRDCDCDCCVCFGDAGMESEGDGELCVSLPFLAVSLFSLRVGSEFDFEIHGGHRIMAHVPCSGWF